MDNITDDMKNAGVAMLKHLTYEVNPGEIVPEEYVSMIFNAMKEAQGK